jgi:hypothetical protein
VTVEYLAIEKIDRSKLTQMRAHIDDDTVKDYAAYLKKAKDNEMTAVVVFFDGKNYILADGFHRVATYLEAGRKRIPVKIKNGTERQAILYAAGANDDHGLRRSPEDKRKAVAILLEDEEWGKASTNWIADTCKVSTDLVDSVRRGVPISKLKEKRASSGAQLGTSTETSRVRGKDGKEYPAREPGADDDSYSDGRPKVGKVKFDWREFDRHWGHVTRGPDDIRRAFPTEDRCQEYQKALELLSLFRATWESWRARLTRTSA